MLYGCHITNRLMDIRIPDGVRLSRHSQKDGKLNQVPKEQKLNFGHCMI